MENKNFNVEEFKKLLNNGDIFGLNYLYDNEIKYYNKISDRQEYIYNLYLATINLNNCVELYETTRVENSFNYDLYTNVRDKLFEELGLKDLYY